MEGPVSYELIPCAHNMPGKSETENPVTGQDPRRLEYRAGKVVKDEQAQTYDQEGWSGG